MVNVRRRSAFRYIARGFLSLLLIWGMLLPCFQIEISAAKYDTSKMNFEEYIIANFENFESTINVLPYAKQFGYSADDISKEVLRIAKSNPDMFHVVVAGDSLFQTDISISTLKGVTTYTAATVSVKYNMKKSEYAARKSAFEKAAKKALAVVQDGMSDVEKALALHDYLILTTEYDAAARDASRAEKESKYSYAYTVEGPLIKNISVCEGYSLSYMYLLEQVGIESKIVRSDVLNHAWNYVKIGSKWYHVDVTSDDPLLNGVRDQLGFANHDFFLINDSELIKLQSKLKSKKDWDTDGLPSSTSKTYTKYFWKGVKTPMSWADGNWYWAELDPESPAYNNNYEKIRGTKDYNKLYYRMYHYIVKYNVKDKKKTNLYKIDATWFTNGTEKKSSKSWWAESYVTLFIYKDRIYFNTAKQVKSIDLKGKNVKTVFSPKLNGGYIYGIRLSGTKVQATVKENPADKNTLKSKKL